MKDAIQTLNYCTHAIDDLSNLKKLLSGSAPQSAHVMGKIIELLDSSVKFFLPNCCDIIDPEQLRQSHFDLSRLPYPIVALKHRGIPWMISMILAVLNKCLR